MSPNLFNGAAFRKARTTPQKLTALALLLSGSCLAIMGVPANAIADSVTLHPYSMKVVRGQASKSSVTPLASNNQRGRSDDWASYVEFYPEARGMVSVMRFRAPVDIASQPLDSLVLKTNFKGPAWSEQRYTWHLRNFNTGRWVRVGTNQGVPDWVWTQQSFQTPGNVSDFMDPLGRLLARFGSPASNDNSNLDHMALELTTTTATPDGPVADTSDVWSPTPGTSWQIQLQGNLNTSLNVDMYDIDLFDTSTSVIDDLKSRNIAVICYFSAGSWEDWRTDAGQIPASVRGASNGWPGEQWLDIRAIDTLAPVMAARMDLAVAKGCDGVDPDNVDGYTNNSGFPLTAQHQFDYNRWLAAEAHARGLSIGLKNNLLQVEELEPYFDFALNESCLQYNECDLLTPFVDAGKAVFGIEYLDDPADFCSTTNALNFDWLKKPKNLMAARESCR